MPRDVQLDEAPATLLATAQRVVPGWLLRVAAQACERGGVDPAVVGVELERTAEAAENSALARLAELLATDVDRQRTTPLSVFRDATSPIAASATGPWRGASGRTADELR